MNLYHSIYDGKTGKNETMKKNKILFDLLIYIVCCFSTIFIIIKNTSYYYSLMFLLPFSFMLVYFLFFKKNIRKFKEFGIPFIIVCFSRYIITPILIVLSGRYDGRSVVPPSLQSFNHAFLLMIYELFVCGFAFYYLANKLENYKKNKELKSFNIELPKTKIIYYLFLLMMIAIIIIKPNLLLSFSFIFPNQNGFQYNNFELLDQILILFICCAKNILYICLMCYLYKKYLKNPKSFIVFISLFISIMNGIIYFGTNRFDFILCFVSSFILFGLFYKKYIKRIVLPVMLIGIICFTSLTQFRNYQKVSQDSLYNIADEFQAYLGGPYNVAMSFETAYAYPEGRNVKTFIFDFARSTLGLNVIVRNIDGIKTSGEYFNKRIYFSDHTSQIIPMIGEGYYLLGFIFAPFIDIIFILIAFYMKKVNINKNRVEIVFFFMITYIRLGFIMAQNASIQMNDLSFNLFLPLILFFINNLFKKNNRLENI